MVSRLAVVTPVNRQDNEALVLAALLQGVRGVLRAPGPRPQRRLRAQDTTACTTQPQIPVRNTRADLDWSTDQEGSTF